MDLKRKEVRKRHKPCACLHMYIYHPKTGPCKKCYCPQYEPVDKFWKRNPHVDPFLYPEGRITSAAEIARRSV